MMICVVAVAALISVAFADAAVSVGDTSVLQIVVSEGPGPYCVGERDSFNTGYGDCKSYSIDRRHHFKFCGRDFDKRQGYFASQVCHECKRCINAAPGEAAKLVEAKQVEKPEKAGTQHKTTGEQAHSGELEKAHKQAAKREAEEAQKEAQAAERKAKEEEAKRQEQEKIRAAERKAEEAKRQAAEREAEEAQAAERMAKEEQVAERKAKEEEAKRQEQEKIRAAERKAEEAKRQAAEREAEEAQAAERKAKEVQVAERKAKEEQAKRQELKEAYEAQHKMNEDIAKRQEPEKTQEAKRWAKEAAEREAHEVAGRKVKEAAEDNGVKADRRKAEHTVLATGDPHLVNMFGQRFDVFKPGNHTLIRIPKDAPDHYCMLNVEADARQMGGACADLYFQSVTVTGAWANTVARSMNSTQFRARTDGLRFFASSIQKPTNVQWIRFGNSIGFGNAIDLKIVWGHSSSGIRYLNILVKHLSKVKYPVGGLLGEDDHTVASTVPPQCKRTISL